MPTAPLSGRLASFRSATTTVFWYFRGVGRGSASLGDVWTALEDMARGEQVAA